MRRIIVTRSRGKTYQKHNIAEPQPRPRPKPTTEARRHGENPETNLLGNQPQRDNPQQKPTTEVTKEHEEKPKSKLTADGAEEGRREFDE